MIKKPTNKQRSNNNQQHQQQNQSGSWTLRGLQLDVRKKTKRDSLSALRTPCVCEYAFVTVCVCVCCFCSWIKSGNACDTITAVSVAWTVQRRKRKQIYFCTKVILSLLLYSLFPSSLLLCSLSVLRWTLVKKKKICPVSAVTLSPFLIPWQRDEKLFPSAARVCF